MKGLNHLVLAGRDLDAMRSVYAGLGFTLTPRAQHPFGTGNTVIQLRGCYLELLAVTRPEDVVEHGAEDFSFSAFNRDYLARHEGFSMLVLDSTDAAADLARWREAGLRTHAPFAFSRRAVMPDGEEVTVGFALAFVSNPRTPWLGLFACQHFRPQYYEQPQFLTHANGAERVADVWIVAAAPDAALGYLAAVIDGAPGRDAAGNAVFATPTGSVVVATPEAFAEAFGSAPPNLADGPHLAGLTIASRDMERVERNGMLRIGRRLVVPPAEAFGVALGFAAAG